MKAASLSYFRGVLCLYWVLSAIVLAAPANDACVNAIPITLSVPYSGSTVGATGSMTSGCSYNDRLDVWHTLTPANSGNHMISLCGSGFDTTLAVYDACGGSKIACNDDVCSVQSKLIASLTAGHTYSIRIAGYNGATGSYTLVADEWFIPPANDDFVNATEVFEYSPHLGTTLGATGGSYSSCAQGYDFYDVWHYFIAPAGAQYTFSLCSSGFNTTLAVHNSQDVEIACDDNSCNPQSTLNATLTGGQTYFIRVAGYDGDAGDYVLNITRTLQTPPHDNCTQAIAVPLNTLYYGTTRNATGNKSSSCGGNDKLDVWHTFTPQQSGYHTLSLCGSSFDTTLSVYASCTGAELACNDNMCDVQSEVVVALTAGLTYRIRIAGKANKTGDYTLIITERFQQPENDTCPAAIDVFENIPYNGTTFGALGSIGSSCGYYFDFYDVWHAFTPTETKDYLISLCGSDFDTTLSVYAACGGAELACNDDSCGRQSALVIPLTAGQSYYLRISGYDGDMGNYTLTVMENVGSPVNDACTEAIELLPAVLYEGTTAGASGSQVSGCSDTDNLDVWHSFTPSADGNYTLSLCGSAFDTTLAVYDACGGAELACNDDFCGTQSQLNVYLNAAQTYMIRVAGYRNAMGDYSIVVSSDCPPLPEPVNPGPLEFAFNVALDPVLTWNAGAQIVENTRGTQIGMMGLYGPDDRLDHYQVTNPLLKEIGDATAAMVPLGDLTVNGDGTYSIPSTSLAEVYLNLHGRPLCPEEPFRTQPAASKCTAFLVAPDIAATTGHCMTDDGICAERAFVFGFQMLNAATPRLTFDASDVYFCAGIISRTQTSNADWALIRLDREVLTHRPLIVRREGKILDAQDVVVIGHTLGLPLKYAANAWLQVNTAPGNFSANLDAYMGNSGSPVINADHYSVEGLLFTGSPDFVQNGDCDVSAQYPDSGSANLERATRTTEFSDLIPVFDVYLGTHADAMELICADSPRPWCQAPALQCGTTYFWQVVIKNNCTQTVGPLWVFSTQWAGDLDHDCDVDLQDFSLFAAEWMNSECNAANIWCQGRDIDKAGGVDLQDLLISCDHWLLR